MYALFGHYMRSLIITNWFRSDLGALLIINLIKSFKVGKTGTDRTLYIICCFFSLQYATILNLTVFL